MFKSIDDPKRKSVIVADQILQAIESSDISPGDKLPSEHDLAEQMNVSRPSIREALSGLQAIGVVEAKAGSGTYVSQSLPTLSNRDPNLSFLEKEASHLHIVEARDTIETAVVDIIFDKIDDQTDFSQLRSVLERMKSHSTDREYQQYMDADHDFHLTLLQLTKNPLVEQALTPLADTINGKVYRELTRKYYLIDDQHIQRCYNIHRAIHDALVGGDLQKAKHNMHRHWTLMKEALTHQD